MKNKNNSRQKLNKGKDGRPRLITEKGHPSADVLLNPNCSETVFRLTGTVEDIKGEMNNMLDWIKQEYTQFGAEKLRPQIAKQIKQIRKDIKKAKTLEELEEIYIAFTCNYETFFKKDGDDLLVATCNNYNWDNVNMEDAGQIEQGRDFGYYDVAGYTRYIYIEDIEGYKVLLLKYMDDDHDKYPKYLLVGKEAQLFEEDDISEKTLKVKKGDDIKLILRKNCMKMLHDNRLMDLPLMKDKETSKKIKLLIELNWDNYLIKYKDKLF